MPTLEITTKLGCSLACRFCPQDRLVRSYPLNEARELTFDNFKTVLAKVPPHVRIDFSGMSEPWLNSEATAMAVHAFENRPKVALYTTLQGMTPEDALMLITRFGDRITPETPWVIHLPDNEGNMKGWRGTDDYFRAVGHFVEFCRGCVHLGLTFMTMSREGAVADVLRAMFPDRLEPFIGVSRVENLDRVDFSPGRLLAPIWHEEAVMCASTPFFDHNTMLPNGDVVLCCMDYSRRHVLGNLLRQDYADLFTGAEMGRVRVRAMGAVGDDEELACRRCHNAVCVAQGQDTHWRMRRDAMWSGRPDPVVNHPALGRRKNVESFSRH